MEKGLIHIYCGDGKGKTTAAVGLSLRVAGSRKKVLFFQFLKNSTSSEIKELNKNKNIEVIFDEKNVKFTFQMTRDEKNQITEHYNEKIIELIKKSHDYDVLVLDEAVYAVSLGVLSENILLNELKNKKESLEVVLTGQNPSQKLIDLADYVSEIKKIKHPFDQKIKSRKGIEY